MSPSISVIMPAYNAERTIELALRSIRMQTIADQIEILVIDGGSTDATREIARQYGAVILENPHRLPEPAKLIGIQRAKGRYVVKQDTDEELIDPRQLERRIEFFSRHPQVRCIVCDEQRPDLNGGISALMATRSPSLSIGRRRTFFALLKPPFPNVTAMPAFFVSHLVT